MTTTDLRKLLKKARIDGDITLSEMAEALGVSMSFLSFIENGKKKINKVWAQKIYDFFLAKGIEIDKSEFDISDFPVEKKILLSLIADKDFSLDDNAKIMDFISKL